MRFGLRTEATKGRVDGYSTSSLHLSTRTKATPSAPRAMAQHGETHKQ